MAEELTAYLLDKGVATAYIHSDVDTIDRVRIMEDLRAGTYDVLVGVNLLREGLDLPEVSLVAILDADKEGFLRSHRSLTQTAGRAARNVNGRVIMYADRVTDSMRQTIDETNRRREKQLHYNEAHGITPQQIRKELGRGVLVETAKAAASKTPSAAPKAYAPVEETAAATMAADPVLSYMTPRAARKIHRTDAPAHAGRREETRLRAGCPIP